MLDDNPDMAVILAKVAGFSWSTAQCILLRATSRALSVQDLDRALSGFSRLKASTARSIIEFYDARRQGTAMPVQPRADILRLRQPSLPRRCRSPAWPAAHWRCAD
jgi:hypothetical protein